MEIGRKGYIHIIEGVVAGMLLISFLVWLLLPEKETGDNWIYTEKLSKIMDFAARTSLLQNYTLSCDTGGIKNMVQPYMGVKKVYVNIDVLSLKAMVANLSTSSKFVIAKNETAYIDVIPADTTRTSCFFKVNSTAIGNYTITGLYRIEIPPSLKGQVSLSVSCTNPAWIVVRKESMCGDNTRNTDNVAQVYYPVVMDAQNYAEIRMVIE